MLQLVWKASWVSDDTSVNFVVLVIRWWSFGMTFRVQDFVNLKLILTPHGLMAQLLDNSNARVLSSNH